MSSLGNYRIIRPLGGGTFGKVKLAENKITSSLVAIKILNKREIQERNLLKKVKREIRLLESFHHPNIIKLYEVIDSATSLLLVMEFLPGGELYNVIERNGKISEDKSREYFQQILAGIDYIHSKGFTHRDLKPENILVDKDGNLKIGDFGLSNDLPVGEYLKTSCGSPNYAAPEVISSSKYCGTEVDIWSLGVILFSLVAGRLPYDESSIPALFAKIKSAKYEMPFFFSKQLVDLMERIFQVDSIRRITSEQIWRHPWNCNQIPYSLVCKRMMKELYKQSINIKALKDTLSYPEFVNINIEHDLLNALTGKIKDEYGILPIYKIFVDIELAKRRKEIENNPIKVSIFHENCMESMVLDSSTKSSSYIDAENESGIPCNWAYGIRCSLQPCFFMIKLLESFTEAGLRWKRVSAFNLVIKGKSSKGEVIIYKMNDTFIVDCIFKKGNSIEFCDSLYQVYICLYRNIHY